MRTGFFIFLGFAAGPLALAQTNTFPSSGNVGIGTTSPATMLDAAGTIRATAQTIPSSGAGTEIIWSGGQGYVTAYDRTAGVFKGLNLYGSTIMLNSGTGGYVGIGTNAPSAKLFVGSCFLNNAAGAMSSTFATNAGSLPATPGAELPLASIGCNSGNNIALGIRAMRTTAGTDWNSTAIGFGLDVDNTPRAGNASLWLSSNGNIGIGTTNPAYPLSVNGTVRAKEVIVDTGWSDYVFADNYKLKPLSELEQQIKAEKHLPGIPSAKEVAEHGVNMGEMQAKLLGKIEELTLHQIEQEKRLHAQENLIQHQAEEILLLKQRID